MTTDTKELDVDNYDGEIPDDENYIDGKLHWQYDLKGDTRWRFFEDLTSEHTKQVMEAAKEYRLGSGHTYNLRMPGEGLMELLKPYHALLHLHYVGLAGKEFYHSQGWRFPKRDRILYRQTEVDMWAARDRIFRKCSDLFLCINKDDIYTEPRVVDDPVTGT